MTGQCRPGTPPGRRPALARQVIALCLLALAVPAGATTVQVLKSGDRSHHREAVAGLRAALADDVRLVVRVVGADGPPETGEAAALVAIGTEALRIALDDHLAVPVLAVLVPRRSFESLAGGVRRAGQPVAALYLGQPLDRQRRVARALFPTLERFGAVVAERSRPADFATPGAALAGLEIERSPPGEPPVRAVTRLARRVDAIIGIPDPRIYSARTIHGILLASYRANVPLAGYSRALVQAGGLVSAWLPPRAHGTDAARMLAPYLAGDSAEWPASRYSDRFRIAVNERVARSLALEAAVATAGRVFRKGAPIE